MFGIVTLKNRDALDIINIRLKFDVIKLLIFSYTNVLEKSKYVINIENTISKNFRSKRIERLRVYHAIIIIFFFSELVTMLFIVHFLTVFFSI